MLRPVRDVPTAPAYRCNRCEVPLVAGEPGYAENLDGTSGDAEVTRFTCSMCTRVYTRWRVPEVALEDGQLVVAHWRELWSTRPRGAT